MVRHVSRFILVFLYTPIGIIRTPSEKVCEVVKSQNGGQDCTLFSVHYFNIADRCFGATVLVRCAATTVIKISDLQLNHHVHCTNRRNCSALCDPFVRVDGGSVDIYGGDHHWRLFCIGTVPVSNKALVVVVTTGCSYYHYHYTFKNESFRDANW